MVLADSGGGGVPTTTTVAGVDFTGLGVIGAVLSGIEIAIDAAQVAEINGHLDDAGQFLIDARQKLAEIPTSAVGGSPVGQQLAHHSTLANDALHTTLENMEAGVVYYREMIQAAVAKLTDADEGAGATSRKGESCVTATPTNLSCTGDA